MIKCPFLILFAKHQTSGQTSWVSFVLFIFCLNFLLWNISEASFDCKRMKYVGIPTFIIRKLNNVVCFPKKNEQSLWKKHQNVLLRPFSVKSDVRNMQEKPSVKNLFLSHWLQNEKCHSMHFYFKRPASYLHTLSW